MGGVHDGPEQPTASESSDRREVRSLLADLAQAGQALDAALNDLRGLTATLNGNQHERDLSDDT